MLNNRNAYSIKKDIFSLLLRLNIVAGLVLIVLYYVLCEVKSTLCIAAASVFFALSIFLMVFIKKNKAVRVPGLVYGLFLSLAVTPSFLSLGTAVFSSVPFVCVAIIITLFAALDRKDIVWVFILGIYWSTFWFAKIYLWKKVNPIINSHLGYFITYSVSFFLLGTIMFLVISLNERNYKYVIHSIEKSRDAEKLAGAAKSRFLANMSHEIRTPMNAIIGLSELVLKDDMEEDIRNEVNIIRQSSYDLLEIIDDVLMYAKLDSGKMKLLNVDFRFDDLLKQVLDAVRNNIGTKDIKVRVSVDHYIPKVVNGDDIRIKQVIMSLVFISLSLTENGRLMISVKSERCDCPQDVKMIVTVSDTGCGLSEVDLGAIKGAYSVYDSRQNSNLKGVALKFNVCEELVKMMGGSLRLRSIEGVGLESEVEFVCGIVNSDPLVEVNDIEDIHALIYISDNRELANWKAIMEGFKIRPDYVNSYFAFEKALKNTAYNYLFLPSEAYPGLSNVIQSYDCQEYTYVLAYSKNSYGDFDKCRMIYHPVSCLSIQTVFNGLWKAEDYIAKNEDISYDGSNAKILVVDDNGVNLKVAEGIFKSLNIAIDMAKSGYEAIEKLKEKEYHLVLMDMVMPEISGVETLRKMRESSNPGMKEVPVIALTANAGGNIREEILDEGFQEYLAKPIKLRYLIQMLIKFLPPGILKRKNSEKKEEQASAQIIPPKADDNILNTNKGLKSLGDNMDAYIAVLNTFYTEGLHKLDEIPASLSNNDIKLFTTYVHGVKSSGASVGAERLSLMFKELEMAGKENNISLINENLPECMNSYKKILLDVREYLERKGCFEGEKVNLEVSAKKTASSDDTASGFTSDMLRHLSEILESMDFEESEKLFAGYSKKDFGSEINERLSRLKDAYTVFDFNLARTLLDELSVIAS